MKLPANQLSFYTIFILSINCWFSSCTSEPPEYPTYDDMQEALTVREDVYRFYFNRDTLLDSLTAFPNLQSLTLLLEKEDSVIKTFPILPNLKRLAINQAPLATHITPFLVAIKQMPQLEELHLNTTSITLEKNQFQQLKKLKYLHLPVINGPFPASIFSLVTLEELYLFYGYQELVEEQSQHLNAHQAIGQLQQLKKLTLYHWKLKELPASIGELASLEDLYIYGQQLQTLPPSFKNLQQLKKISLSHASFSEFPEELLSLKNLQHLNLSDCNLSTLPKNISSMNSLEYLNLSYNPLSKQQIIDIQKALPNCEVIFSYEEEED